ncbi:hypothetical protein LTR70_008431 [Exophiala xenobiotica]|nr:hypothetical protein LTR70_008431 [Exophiala xenobiotica]
MASLMNPFAKSRAKPGEGEIVLSVLPPGKQVLTKFEYQYPLKLISPDPHKVTVTNHDHDGKPKDSTRDVPITTVFLLTYGGGLLAGDSINLTVTLEPHTRLALLTQGSTKIFKSKSSTSTTTATSTTAQTLPLPVASPFATTTNQPSRQTLNQNFYVDPFGSSSILLLDWVNSGRPALNEKWTLSSWKGRNEIREFDEYSNGRLLIRDALLLFNDDNNLADLSAKTDGKGILGTLIIYGPLFKSLADFFMKEFKSLPRIGAKNWNRTPAPRTPTVRSPMIREEQEDGPEDYFGQKSTSASASASGAAPTTPRARQKKEEETEGLLWTTAQARGFVLVKFGAAEVDEARRWLDGMLKREGSVQREFGHQAMLCLR